MIPKFTEAVMSLNWNKNAEELLCPPVKEKVLSSVEVEYLKGMYKLLYTDGILQDVHRIVTYSHRAISNRLKFFASHVSNASAVLALWGVQSQDKLMFGEIEYIMQSTATVMVGQSVQEKTHIIAKVKWFMQHPLLNTLGFPWKILYNDYQPLQITSFIPLSRIATRCAKLLYVIDHSLSSVHADETVVAIAPVDFISSDFILHHLL